MTIGICYEMPTKFARYTVADGTGIEKGDLLDLSSPNTASYALGSDAPAAGIAWMEKVANDGSTEIVAALDGVWGLESTAAAISVGSDVKFAGANQIKQYSTLDDEKGITVGKALETIGATSTVIKVRLGVK